MKKLFSRNEKQRYNKRVTVSHKRRMHKLLIFFILLVPVSGILNAQDEALNSPEQNNAVVGGNAASSLPGAESIAPADEKAPVPTAPQEAGAVLGLLQFKDADIISCLKVIEQKSGLTIKADSDVQGTVSLMVKDIPVPDALKIILEPLQLAYIQQEKQIRVLTAKNYLLEVGRDFAPVIQTRIIPVRYASPQGLLAKIRPLKSDSGKIFLNEDSPGGIIAVDVPKALNDIEAAVKAEDVPLETEIFDLQYMLAPEVAENLRQKLDKNIGQIHADERANKIVVTDTASQIPRIENFIKELDKARDIRMEAKIVRVDLSDEHEKGIDWEAILSEYKPLQTNGGVDKTGKRDICIGTVSSEDYPVLMDALDLVGDMTTFSVSENNISGKTDQDRRKTTLLHLLTKGENVNFSLVSPFLESSNVEKQPSDVDVRFVLTPMVHLDETLSLDISPLTDQNHGQAVLELKPGEIIVIGGIFKDEKIDRTKKFPVLGDLPFFGFVFRSRTTDLRRIEYIIILMPKIINPEI